MLMLQFSIVQKKIQGLKVHGNMELEKKSGHAKDLKAAMEAVRQKKRKIDLIEEHSSITSSYLLTAS